MIKFDDIQNAFYYVSSASYGMREVVVDTVTGNVFYRSEFGGYDDISGSELNWDNVISIPHKNDLDLGQELVLRFVDCYLPQEYNQVRTYFHRSGAYQKFKSLLSSKDLLQKWYDFENKEEMAKLELWCKDYGIDIEGSG